MSWSNYCKSCFAVTSRKYCSKCQLVNTILRDPFMESYFDALVWIACEDSINEDHTIYNITQNGLETIVKECEAFQETHAELLEQAGDDSQNGHDLALTRNHCGAGFWDRGYSEEIGQALTNASQELGEIYLHSENDVLYLEC